MRQGLKDIALVILTAIGAVSASVGITALVMGILEVLK
jgi:hypothetical protein